MERKINTVINTIAAIEFSAITAFTPGWENPSQRIPPQDSDKLEILIDPSQIFIPEQEILIPELDAILNPLDEYLLSIQPEKKRLVSIIENQGGNIMSGIKNLSLEQNLEDFNMYFAIYLAAERKYSIPWPISWSIHAHETATSRNPNPNGSGHIGAMQLTERSIRIESIASAPEGWEFLDDLPQRYSQKNAWPTNDWEDILKGASFIRLLAGWGAVRDEEGNEVLDHKKDEALILAVVRSRYSALEHGIARVNKYLELKKIFEN